MDFWKSLAPKGEIFICEECGRECEYYYHKNGQIIGCENCIYISFAWDE